MKNLDFICVGPGRTGTTALFMALRQHPDVYIPPEKECPIGEMPVDVYMKKYFGEKADGKMMGTITPHYCHHPGCAHIIKSLWPAAKIIIVLRHPIERAYSHWRMNTSRGMEHASFDEAFKRAGNTYRFRSMYGRNLGPYFDLFKDIHVLFSRDLRENPEMAIIVLENFLGLNLFIPNNLHKNYNGSQNRASGIQRILRKIPGVKIVPEILRARVWWHMQRSGKPSIEMDLDRYLDKEFRDDKKLMEDLAGCQMPW